MDPISSGTIVFCAVVMAVGYVLWRAIGQLTSVARRVAVAVEDVVDAIDEQTDEVTSRAIDVSVKLDPNEIVSAIRRSLSEKAKVG
jgi:hypothetical protein